MRKLITGINSLWSLFLQDSINFFHLKDGYSTQDKKIRTYARELRKNGILVLPSFASPEVCDKLYASAKKFLAQFPESTRLGNGTNIHYRGMNNGPDKGMVDVSFIEKSMPDVDALNTELPDEIMRSVSTMDLYLSSIHLYYNKNISGTRIDHVDNCQPVIYKGFLYLTDVEDESYGPYSFIKGTHRFSFLIYFNLFANIFKKRYRITDMPVIFGQKRIIATGKKGTLVLSNQNGIHSGLPQKDNRERMALILNYLLLSKLNYKHATIKEVIKHAKKKIA